MRYTWQPRAQWARGLPLYAIEFFGYCAAYASPVVLGFAVIATGGSASVVGLVLAADTLGMVAIVLVGGLVADRVSRRRVVILSEVTAAAAQAVAGLLLLGGVPPLPWLVLTQGLVGCSRGFLFPTMTSLVPSVVPSDRLQAVNGILASAQSVARLAGPAVAGLVVAAVGGHDAVWLLATLYAASATSASFLPGIRSDRPGRETSRLAELAAGWRSFRSRRWIWVTVAWFAFASALTQAPVLVLGPSIAAHRYGGAAAWGLVMGAGGAGAFVGGALAAVGRGRRSLRGAIAMYAVAALLPLALGLSAPVAVLGASAVVGGVAAGYFSATWFTVFQQNVPTKVMSRTSAWDWLLSLSVLPLCMITVPSVADRVGNETTIVAAAAAAVLITVLAGAARSVAITVRRTEHRAADLS